MMKFSLSNLIEDELDFDFRADSHYINTVDEFEKFIIAPANEKQVFFRGERKSSISRPLIPSIYRDKSILFDKNDRFRLITVNELYDYYKKRSEFFELFEKIIGEISKKSMYSFLAFSQHYFGISPLIDLTKNPYVALSFALKDREVYNSNILIYTVEPKNKDDYTTSVEVANAWISDYSVLLFDERIRPSADQNIDIKNDFKLVYEKNKHGNFLKMNSPSAKLIDVPTNDLMRFQQGVFLLLDDFTLLGKSYLTKKIRDDFAIKKWIVSKSICPELCDIIRSQYPYYTYDCITDLSKVASKLRNK